MKIAVIGAGSTYTPELAEGLILEANALGLEELYLHDIDEERLEIVGGLVQRMVQAQGSPFRVQCTLNRVEAVSGADFVIHPDPGGWTGRSGSRYQDLPGRGDYWPGNHRAGGFCQSHAHHPCTFGYLRRYPGPCPRCLFDQLYQPCRDHYRSGAQIRGGAGHRAL